MKSFSEASRTIIVQNCLINSNANLIENPKTGQITKVGNQTECCLIDFCKFNGYDCEKYRKQFTDVKSIAFSSDRKRMTTFFVVPSDYPFVRVLVKGAAEIVLERCSHIVGKNGEIKALSHEEKEVINRDVIIANAEKEYRNISIAYKDIILDDFEKVKNLNSDEDIDFLENNLIFVAICGIQDPLRPGIKEAI